MVHGLLIPFIRGQARRPLGRRAHSSLKKKEKVGWPLGAIYEKPEKIMCTYYARTTYVRMGWCMYRGTED